MDEKEKKLIAELRKNGREKVTEIAGKHGLSASTLFDVLHRMEGRGVLKHTSLVDFQSLGYQTHLIFIIKTTIPNRSRLKEYLSKEGNINMLLQINSGFDYMFEALFRNQREASDFITRMESENRIVEMTIHNIIDVVHREKFLTEEWHFEEEKDVIRNYKEDS